MAQEVPKSIIFEYTQADYYRTVVAHGARGTITPRGEVVFELYTESLRFPSQEERELTGEGRLGKVLGEVEESVVLERQLHSRFIMSVGDAMTFAEWLKGKVDQYNRVKKEMAGE